jgi:hypothetical protein
VPVSMRFSSAGLALNATAATEIYTMIGSAERRKIFMPATSGGRS